MLICPYAYVNGKERAKCKLTHHNNPNDSCHHSWDGKIQSITTSCGVAYRGWYEGRETVQEEKVRQEQLKDVFRRGLFW